MAWGTNSPARSKSKYTPELRRTRARMRHHTAAAVSPADRRIKARRGVGQSQGNVSEYKMWVNADVAVGCNVFGLPVEDAALLCEWPATHLPNLWRTKLACRLLCGSAALRCDSA